MTDTGKQESAAAQEELEVVREVNRSNVETDQTKNMKRKEIVNNW
jgi:hypothetical protein